MQRALWRYDGAGDPVPCEIVELMDDPIMPGYEWRIRLCGVYLISAARGELELVLRQHCNMTHSTKGRGSD